MTTNTLTLSSQPVAGPAPASNSKSDTTAHTDSRVRKRNLNTLAARRYRQRRTDETERLAAKLKETQIERDNLKILVARLQGQLDGLRQTLPVPKSD